MRSSRVRRPSARGFTDRAPSATPPRPLRPLTTCTAESTRAPTTPASGDGQPGSGQLSAGPARSRSSPIIPPTALVKTRPTMPGLVRLHELGAGRKRARRALWPPTAEGARRTAAPLRATKRRGTESLGGVEPEHLFDVRVSGISGPTPLPALISSPEMRVLDVADEGFSAASRTR